MKRLSEKSRIRAERLRLSKERRRLKRKAWRALLKRVGRESIDGEKKSIVLRIKSPKRLTLKFEEASCRAETLKFFEKILRKPDPDAGIRIMVDMRKCERIDLTAGVWLIATVEIASKRFPGCINGLNPENREARAILDALRFHQTLKFLEPPDVEKGHELMRGILEIETRSGGVNESAGVKMPAAGAAISEILPDSSDQRATARLRDEIHRAINEALLNVSQHAYGSHNQDAAHSDTDESEHRWWAVGIVHKIDKTLDLFVVDRGVGIPETLRRNVREFAADFFAGKTLSHGDRIRAAMEFGRSSVSQGENRGKGMPQMLDLLERFPNSMLLVESLRGIYVADYDGAELTQDHSDNKDALPGTLVWWHLDFGSESNENANERGTDNEGN